MSALTKLQKLSLLPEPGYLVVSLWSFGPGGWKIACSEKVAVPGDDPLAEQLLSAIRPLMAKWNVAPETPVLAGAPAGVGGFLSFSCPRVARKDLDALIDFEMTKFLPFSPKELERSHQAKAAGKRWDVSVFWLPRSWVAEMKNALARVGLRLSEVFHRAHLTGAVLAADNAMQAWGCIERDGAAAHLHFYRQGAMPERSRCIPAGATPLSDGELARELALDLIALDGSGLKPAVLYASGMEGKLPDVPSLPRLQPCPRLPDLPQRLLVLWKQGGSGIWLAPDKASVTARLIPLLIMLVIAGAILAGAAWWAVAGLREETQALEADVKRLTPRHRKALETEHDILRAQQELDGIAGFSTTLSPLEPLQEIQRALPQEAWLVAFRQDGTAVEIEGYGTDSHELGENLQQDGKFSAIAPLDAQVARDDARRPFALKMQWGAAR